MSLNVLYIEDDLGLAQLLKKRLGRHGYEVEVAADGEEGLSLLEHKNFEAVLVDYSMPVLNGMEVVRRIVQRDPSVPVVMVTGNGDEKVAVEAMKLGATDYLVKDVEMTYLELLPMVLDKVIAARRLAAERQEALLSIRESEERYRKLVELSPDGIVICCQSRIEFANPAAVRLLGARSAEEILGQMILGFVHPESVGVFQSQLDLIESSCVSVPWLEERFVRLDYSELAVEVSGIPFKFRGQPAVQIIFRDITARVQAKHLLEQMAYYDQLTGLANRVLFFDRLETNLAQAGRYRFPFALLYLDLDGFKKVNDTRGHDKGDQLLVQVADRLKSFSRRSDTLARIGGDEFVIMMCRIKGPEAAEVLAKKVLAAIKAPFHIGGESFSIGLSIGISIYPSDAEDVDGLVKKADTAMYEAKQQGGNVYRHFADLHPCHL